MISINLQPKVMPVARKKVLSYVERKLRIAAMLKNARRSLISGYKLNGALTTLKSTINNLIAILALMIANRKDSQYAAQESVKLEPLLNLVLNAAQNQTAKEQ